MVHHTPGPPSVTWPRVPDEQINHHPAKHFHHRVRLDCLINGRADHVPDEKWVYLMDQPIRC